MAPPALNHHQNVTALYIATLLETESPLNNSWWIYGLKQSLEYEVVGWVTDPAPRCRARAASVCRLEGARDAGMLLLDEENGMLQKSHSSSGPILQAITVRGPVLPQHLLVMGTTR